MLKRVNYIFDGSAVFLMDATNEDDAINKAIEAHISVYDYYEEEELDEVNNTENYEVVDVASDLMYELKDLLDMVNENESYISLSDNDVITIQFD